MLCYVILCLLCYAMVGCCAVPCPKNFSAQSDPVSLCASDNKILDLTDVLLALCAVVLENSLGPCQLLNSMCLEVWCSICESIMVEVGY